MILVSSQDNREGPMESFIELFGSLLALVYHCFDRMVILGHIPLLTRPENIDHFFRDVHQSGAIAAFEAEALNVHVDFPLFQRMTMPIPSGRTRVPGIEIHDTRMSRLMEVLLHCGTIIGGWRTAEIHEAILSAFGVRLKATPSPNSATISAR
jgi:hypothetical protein